MYTIDKVNQDFINHCKFEKNLSRKTIKAYSIDLVQFKTFLSCNHQLNDIRSVTKIEVRSFLEHLSNLKPKSIKRKIATIKAMFNYLEFDETIHVNPMRKTRISIKEAKALPKVMNLQEVLKIVKAAYTNLNAIKRKQSYAYFEGLRNVAVIELLFATGSRVSEIAELKFNQIDLKTGIILIKGKGNKERILQVCSEGAITILKRYVEIASERNRKSEDCFFINRFGNQLSDQSIRAIVKKYSLAAKITRKITPHVFRHSFATLLLEKDVDIKYIQSLLGHSSILTTQIYTHVNQKQQRKILSTKHPRMDKPFQGLVML